MEVPEKKRMKVVAYRLRGGASAWWENNRRFREGKQPVRTWYWMKQLLKKDFFPQTMSKSFFSNTRDVIRVLGQSMNIQLSL